MKLQQQSKIYFLLVFLKFVYLNYATNSFSAE